MIPTFIDAGVLIAGARGITEAANAAMAVLDDPEREFASSDFIKLEVLPKAIYSQKPKEVAFYEAFFDAVKHWSEDLNRLVIDAERIGRLYGLSALDALHIAAAEAVGAEEFITTERPDKPMFRIGSIKIISLSALTSTKR